MAFHRLNCFCYHFISPLKAKESKLETQNIRFAEAELERKSMANANLLSICGDVFSSFFTKQIPNFLFLPGTDTFSNCMLCQGVTNLYFWLWLKRIPVRSVRLCLTNIVDKFA